MLPGLVALADERAPQLDKGPYVAKINDLLEGEMCHSHTCSIALVQHEVRHCSAVEGHSHLVLELFCICFAS